MVQIIDRAINRIGPIFIAIAMVLLAMCVLCYYLVVFPYNHRWSDSAFFGKIYIALTLAWSLYMVYCIFFHYYMAIITPPGNVLDRTGADSRLRHAEEHDPSYAEAHQEVRQKVIWYKYMQLGFVLNITQTFFIDTCNRLIQSLL